MASRIPSMNWLRVFEAAARTESFARAAEQLNLSSAAVSQQIKALESALGAELFIRAAHSVRLTEAGRAYLPSVAQGLRGIDAATEGLFGPSRDDRLFVRADLLFAQGVLAPSLPAFHRAHPSVSLTLTTALAETETSPGAQDLHILFGVPPAPGMVVDPLLSERIYPVANADLVAGLSGPQDLLRHPLIEVAPHRAGWAQVLDALGLDPGAARILYTDTTLVAVQMAAAGLGVALARAPASDPAVAAAGLVPCLAGWQVAGHDSYHLVYPEARGLRPVARRFRDWLHGMLDTGGNGASVRAKE